MMLTVLTHQLGQPPAARTQDPEAAGHCPHPTELVVGQCSFISGAHVSWLSKSTKQANVTSCKIQHFAKKFSIHTHALKHFLEAHWQSQQKSIIKKSVQRTTGWVVMSWISGPHCLICRGLQGHVACSSQPASAPDGTLWSPHRTQGEKQASGAAAVSAHKRVRLTRTEHTARPHSFKWDSSPCRLLPVWALCLKKLREERFDVETTHSENKTVGVLGVFCKRF